MESSWRVSVDLRTGESGVSGAACAWSTGFPRCGIVPQGRRSLLMQDRLCRLRGRRDILESTSRKVWYIGRGFIVEVLLGVGVVVEIGRGLS